MTTEVKVEYVNGNKAMRVMLGDELKAELLKAGDAVNVLVHSDQKLSVAEHGEFYGNERQSMQANATVDEANTDANRYESEKPPVGGGDEGSNVEDVRVGEEPKNSL